jgi:hypothetical protein
MESSSRATGKVAVVTRRSRSRLDSARTLVAVTLVVPAVVGLDPVVLTLLDVVPRGRHQFLEHPRIDRCSVGDHPGRDHLQRDQSPAEESAGRVAVATVRHEHVDDLAVLIDSPVHVPPHPIDLDIGLVDEPAITRSMARETSRVGEQRREPLHPPVDADVIYLETALGQQLLDIAIRQAVTQIPTHRHRDHPSAGMRKPTNADRDTRRGRR